MFKRKFHNLDKSGRGLWDLTRWLLTRKPTPWPKWIPITPSIPPQSNPPGRGYLTFINHSTVLLQIDETNILIDPIWSERASPFKSRGPKRVHAPGVEFENLPPIHIVLISHNHYDHLDLTTLQKLQQIHKPRFITGLGNKAYLEKRKIYPSFELDWWDSTFDRHELKFTFVPAKHFSARWPWDRNETLWGGFVINTSHGLIFYAGDTGYGEHFKMIRERLGPPALSLLPIGAIEPRWFMEPAHMSPEDAVKAHFDLDTGQSMGIHFGCFPLADEGIEQPLKLLLNALDANKLTSREFWTLRPGQSALL